MVAAAVAVGAGLGVVCVVAVVDVAAVAVAAAVPCDAVWFLVMIKLATPMPTMSTRTRHTQITATMGPRDGFGGGGVPVLNAP